MRRRREKRAFFTNRWLGIALIVAAAPADLHLLLLADRRGALLGLHARAAMGRRQRVGRLRQFRRHALRSRLLELDLAEHGVRGRRAPASAWRSRCCWRSSPTASCAAGASTAPSWSGPTRSRRRRSAMAFRFILAPEAGFLAFINQIWPGLWNPALDGVDAMICHRRRLRLEIYRLQLHLLPRRAAGDPAIADRGGGHGRRRHRPAHARHPAAAADADPVLPRSSST